MAAHGETISTDYGNQPGGDRIAHLGPNEHPDSALHRIRTAGSITISPELFEKLYLTPETQVKGDLRKTFGNPTPLAILGFVLSLTPLSCDLMEWRGAGSYGASDIGVYIFFGGVLMLVAGFLEFILGNTFPFVVFMSFGSFYLSLGSTLQPFYGAFGDYSPSPSNPAAGLKTEGFNASFAFFFVFFDLLCLYYLILSIRTNLVFVWIFFTVVLGVALVAATLFYVAEGKMVLARRCQIAGGACLFACCMGGWYLLMALLLPTVDFPIQLPVFDLSHIIHGASQKKEKKEERNGGGDKA